MSTSETSQASVDVQCDELLRRFLSTIVDVQEFAHITVKAMHQLANAVPLIEAVVNFEALTGTRASGSNQLDVARADATYVEKHKKGGYSLVYAHVIISAWGALEAHIDDVLVALLSRDKTFLSAEALQRTRIPLAVYETLSGTERIEFLLDSIQRELNSRFKKGVGQFESVFEAVGLNGPLEEWLRRAFLEFSAIRNLLVHRRGVVDKRFVETCPWMQLASGDSIVVTQGMAVRYCGAAILYAAIVQRRIDARYGKLPTDREAAIDALIASVTKVATATDEPVTMSATEVLANLPD